MKIEKIIFYFILTVFVATQLVYIPLDMWNDEVYTFIHFVLQPWHILLSDYHVPNNHVFFNITQKLLCNTFTLSSLQDVLNHAYIFRIFQVIVGIASVVLLYETIRKNINTYTALLTIILLLSTLPYLNFVSQLRGYNFSVFMYIVLIHILFKKENEFTLKYKFLFTVTIALLMYTVPSNIYILIATVVAYTLYQLVYNVNKTHLNKMIMLLIVKFQWIMYGFMISLLFYIPMIDKVFKNEYVSYHYFHFNRLWEILVPTMKYFLSYRYELIILIVISIFLLYKKKQKLSPYFIFFFISLFTPFLIIFITGNNVPDRILLPFAVPFAICIALLIAPLVEILLKIRRNLRISILIVCFALFISHILYSIKDMQAHALHDIIQNKRTQNLNYNYYQAYFHPLHETKNIALKYDNRLPITIVGCEPHDIPHYLEAYNLHYTNNSIDSLFTHYDSILVITNHPYHVHSNCVANTAYTTINISGEICYHTSLLLYKSSQ